MSDVGKLLGKNLCEPTAVEVGDSSEDDSSLPRLIWLIGRLKIQMKHLFHLKSETMNAFLNFSGEKPEFVSPSNCWVLRNPDALREYIQNTQDCISKVRTVLSWKEVSHTFWQWTCSVIDAHSVDSSHPPSDDEVHACVGKFNELISNLHFSIDNFITKYPFLNDMQLSLSKNPECETDIPTENLLVDIHKELFYLMEHLTCVNSSDDPTLQLYHFRYNIVNEEEKKLKNGDDGDYDFVLEDECRKLKSIINNLRTKSEHIKHELSQKLQKVGADFLPEAVFLYKDL
ncbi:unnamed protein product [Trichobilharzia regenti]|nr:unnamed protein product [Trichobilharzia regenti]